MRTTFETGITGMSNGRWLFSGVLALAAFAGVAGCFATVPLAHNDWDLRAKSMSAPPDKAIIYLYRNESLGSAVRLPVRLNGRLAGHTVPKTYFMWLVDPGQHEIISGAENTSALIVDTRPGETYYVWQEMKLGSASARSRLQLVDVERGRRGVIECRLIQGPGLAQPAVPGAVVTTVSDGEQKSAWRLEISLGPGYTTASAEDPPKGNGAGAHAAVAYAVPSESKSINPGVYLGVSYTTADAESCGEQVTPCNVSNRIVFAGLKMRLMLPIPHVAPVFGLGIGNVTGAITFGVKLSLGS